MSERETPEAINDRAAEWVALVDRDGGDPLVQARLDDWLAGDSRRQGAYFRARVAWAMLDRASVLAARGPGDDCSEPQRPTKMSRRALWGAGAAMAASVVLVSFGLTLWATQPERIETALGEIRRVPLKDGSIAAVNTSTSLAVNLKPEVRKVALNRGEAWFEVAHDRQRPFIVEAGDVRVKAVGTAFSVRKTDMGVAVQVTEGVVEVWTVGHEGAVRLVSAGSRTIVGDGREPMPAVDASVEIDRSLAWRSGQLVFNGDRLGDAAQDFNRYNKVKVRIADPDLFGESFVGRFRTNEPQAFARAAATILNAQLRFEGDVIVLSRN